ncbi:hypothetical protein NKH95_17565 [Mesorhizobium sp. M0848]|uniref:hypothetical protein n=1 Tax=Mesorhizobium sp. M0848 TaxID=2957012 RepID=UPI00333C85CA
MKKTVNEKVCPSPLLLAPEMNYKDYCGEDYMERMNIYEISRCQDKVNSYNNAMYPYNAFVKRCAKSPYDNNAVNPTPKGLDLSKQLDSAASSAKGAEQKRDSSLGNMDDEFQSKMKDSAKKYVDTHQAEIEEQARIADQIEAEKKQAEAARKDQEAAWRRAQEFKARMRRQAEAEERLSPSIIGPTNSCMDTCSSRTDFKGLGPPGSGYRIAHCAVQCGLWDGNRSSSGGEYYYSRMMEP